jgi:hypothetical protein
MRDQGSGTLPPCSIEITPEMIDAGVDALQTVIGADERFLGNDERAVIRVYRAMNRIHCKGEH